MTTDVGRGSREFAELTAFQRDLLFVIAGFDGETGLFIKEELESYYGETINHGRLYPNLDTLVEKGFIEKLATDGRSNAYTVTNEGMRLLKERIEWERNHRPRHNRTGSDENSEDELEDMNTTAPSHSEPPIDLSNSEIGGMDIDTTLADIPVDKTCNADILLYVTDYRQPSEFKEVDIDVKDLSGEPALLNGWTKHNIQTDLEVGDWFLISGLRLSRWEQQGDEVRSISTIADSIIRKLDGEDVFGGFSSSNSIHDPSSQAEDETSERNLLEKIHREFDVDY